MTLLAGESTFAPALLPSLGPPSTLGDVASAAFEGQLAVRNLWRLAGEREAAYDQRADAIKEAIGVDVGNPLRMQRERWTGPAWTAASQVYKALGADQWSEQALIAYYAKLRELEQQRPEHRDVIAAHIPPDWRLREAAVLAEATEKDVAERRGGGFDVTGFVAGMAGSFGGMLTDPANALSMLIGPMRAVGLGVKQLLWSGIKAGAANAGVEAAQAMGVQSWRARAGLDHGVAEAAKDIGGAFAGGFLLDAGGRALWRGVRTLQGRTTPELDARGGVIGWRAPTADERAGAAVPAPLEAPRAPPPDPDTALEAAARAKPEGTLRKAADGDDDALIALAHQTRATENPELRGAVQELEHFRLWGAPPEVDAFTHLETLAEGIARAVDPHQPPPGPTPVQRPPALNLSPEAQAAQARLHAQEGNVIDLARLMREHPDAVDGAPSLSDLKTRQALAIAALDHAAFERVAAGAIEPNHAALIGRHAADPATHVELLEKLIKAELRNEQEVRYFIADHLAERSGSDPRPHDLRFGRSGADLGPLRAKLLVGALRGVQKDGRIAAVLDREALHVEAGLPDAQRGGAKVRKDLAAKLGNLIEALSHTDSHVAELLHEAALAMNAGARQKTAGAAFIDRLAAIIERDGLDGLVKPRRPVETDRVGIDDPHGPDAEAQTKALEQRIKFSNPERSNAEGGRGTDADLGGRRAGGSGGVSGGQPRAGEGPGGGGGVREAGELARKVRRVDLAEGRVATIVPGHDADGRLTLEYWVHKTGAAGPSERASPKVAAQMLRQLNNWHARVDLTEREPGRFEVGYVRVDPRLQRQGIATQIYDAIEQDLGRPLEPSGQLTEKGHALWRRRNPALVDNHRWLPSQHMFLSPRRMTEDLALLEDLLKQRGLTPQERSETTASIAEYRRALASVPKEALRPEALARSWSIADPVDLRPAAAADLAAIRAGVDRVIQRLPAGVRAEVRQRIVYGGAERNGFWDPHERLVAIALNDRAYQTARHEEVHVLRALGLLSEREWDVLAAHARANDLATLYDVDGRWGAEIAETFKGDKNAIAAALVEETVAEMWARAKFGARFGAGVDGILGRIVQFFDRLRNALAGRGFQSVEDVFRRIETGEVGARAQSQAGDGVRFVMPERPPGERPRPDVREHNRPFALHTDTASLIGIAARPVKIDADLIAAKRNEMSTRKGEANALKDAAAVRALVEITLQSPDVATRKDPQTWNLRKALPDGSWAMVALSTKPDSDGHLRIKTALVQSEADGQIQLIGALKAEGPEGLKFRGGDPGAYGPIIASVSELDRTARGQALDSLFEQLKQRRASELGYDPVALYDKRPNAYQVEKAKRLAVTPNPAERAHVNAERVGELGSLAEVCKR